jgi:hypothetical protein
MLHRRYGCCGRSRRRSGEVMKQVLEELDGQREAEVEVESNRAHDGLARSAEGLAGLE